MLNLNFKFIEPVEITSYKNNVSIKIKKVNNEHTRITLTAKNSINLDTINFFSKDEKAKTKSQILNLAMHDDAIKLFQNNKCKFPNSNFLMQNIFIRTDPDTKKQTPYMNESLANHKNLTKFNRNSLKPADSCAIVLKSREKKNDTIVEISITDNASTQKKLHRFLLP